jgi:hypothetical protein
VATDGAVVAYVSLSDILLLPVLIGYTTWWAFDLRKGTRVRGWTLMVHIVVYGLAALYIWAVSLGEIVLAGAASSVLSWVWTIVLTVVVVAATEAGIWYGGHRLVLERTEAGTWKYRAPLVIAILWLGLYLTRFGLEDGLLGGFSVFLPTTHHPAGVPLGTFVAVVLVVASLYLVSFGFLLGISLTVRDRHRELARATAERSATNAQLDRPSGPVAPYTVSVPPVVAAGRTGISGGFAQGRSPVGAMAAAGSAGSLAASRAPAAVAGARLEISSGGRCPSCGAVVGGHGAFCGACGHAFAPPAGRPIPRPPDTGSSSVGRSPGG